MVPSFKIMMINMFKGLKKKVGNMQDQISNFIREIKNQMKLLKVKSTVMKLNDNFDRLTSILTLPKKKAPVNLKRSQQKLPKVKH